MRLRIFTEPQQGASYETLLSVAKAAEDLGFDAFFRSDHYTKMGDVSGEPGPTDSWVTLGALARETSRIRLGTLVTAGTFRYPGPLAISVAQVDQMSGGRVDFGIGTGWFEEEHVHYGIPFPSLNERFERLEEQIRIVTAADARVATVRAVVTAPLIEQATADGASYLSAQERMWQANRTLNAAGRFGRRPAARTARDADEGHATAADVVRRRWGDVPQTPTGLSAWANAVAGQQADTDPRVIAARQDAEGANQELQHLSRSHADARAALWDGTDADQQPPIIVRAHAAHWRSYATRARRELAAMESLPVLDAAELIAQHRP